MDLHFPFVNIETDLVMCGVFFNGYTLQNLLLAVQKAIRYLMNVHSAFGTRNSPLCYVFCFAFVMFLKRKQLLGWCFPLFLLAKSEKAVSALNKCLESIIYFYLR